MADYTIGQVEKISGVKAHVLRYWEEVVPSIAPLKNEGGHRVYSQRHLEIILRMKYLINERGFTIEGARNQIIKESASYSSRYETIQKIHALRKNLGELYLQLSGEKNNEK